MPQIKRSIERFKAYHEQMIERSATAISKLLHRALSYVEEYPLQENDEASERDKEEIARRYKDALRSFESETQYRIEQIWNHRYLQKEEEHLAFEGMDLFSEESASVFGLTRKELLITAATSGAAAGAGVDLLLGGSSFLLGTGIGAVVGGIGALFAFNELSEIKALVNTGRVFEALKRIRQLYELEEKWMEETGTGPEVGGDSGNGYGARKEKETWT